MFFCGGLFAQIAYGTISLRSQAKVDAYEPATVIYGDLTIEGEDIVNLSNLLATASVSGDLIIQSTSLENLNGLLNLNFIGGDLIITGNPELQDVDGLESLHFVGGDVKITGNASLLHLDGLQKLTEAENSIQVSHNNLLGDLNGLGNLIAVGQDLTISQNDRLSDCCAVADLINSGRIEARSLINDNDLGCRQVLEVLNGCVPQYDFIATQFSTDAISKLEVYPNPIISTVKVEFESPVESVAQLEIVNLQGETVFQKNVNLWEGQNQQLIEAGNLTAGMYVLRLRSENFSVQTKIVKLD